VKLACTNKYPILTDTGIKIKNKNTLILANNHYSTISCTSLCAFWWCHHPNSIGKALFSCG